LAKANKPTCPGKQRKSSAHWRKSPEREEGSPEEAELESRLRALEARVCRVEEITHACRDEVRGLLVAFARSREAKAERLETKSGTAERE
jgi:hypothetical protein